MVASGLLAILPWRAALVAEEAPSAEAPKIMRAEADRCLPWSQVEDRDGDLKRNAKELSRPGICIMQEIFPEGGLRWVFQIIKNNEKNGPLWAVPHDNENAAFDTAVYSVVQHGGTVVAVETGGQRNNGRQDPNRNFDVGANVRCRQQIAPSKEYTKRFLRWWDRSQPIIALHSNTAGGSITIKGKHDHSRIFPSPKPIGAKNPDHTLIFVASVASPDRDPGLQAFVRALNQRGIHVIYERVSNARNDCSMSNYAALSEIRNYLNVEVVHGDSPTQRRIVDDVMVLMRTHQIGPLRERAAPDPSDTVAALPQTNGDGVTTQQKQQKQVAAPDPSPKVGKGKPARYVVQLASEKSEEGAKKLARSFKERFPNVLGASPLTVRKLKSGENYRYQIVTRPLDSEGEAMTLCQNLMSAGGSCSVKRRN